MISCSFSSFTLKVAFGRSSVTTPGNSKSSSFAIRFPKNRSCLARSYPQTVPKFARTLADDGLIHNCVSVDASLIAWAARNETLANIRQNLVAHLPISVEPLFAAAFRGGRIGRRPIFDIGPACPRELQGTVMGFRREGDDEVEIQPLPFVQFLECHRLVAGNVEPDFLHHCDRERVELTLAHSGRTDIDGPAENLLEQGSRDWRSHRIETAGEQNREWRAR